MTAPQSPSKESARSYEELGMGPHQVREVTDLIPDQLLQQTVPSNSEYKAWKEHPKRDDDRSGKCVAQAPVDKASLESNERGEDDQWCR